MADADRQLVADPWPEFERYDQDPYVSRATAAVIGWLDEQLDAGQ